MLSVSAANQRPPASSSTGLCRRHDASPLKPVRLVARAHLFGSNYTRTPLSGTSCVAPSEPDRPADRHNALSSLADSLPFPSPSHLYIIIKPISVRACNKVAPKVYIPAKSVSVSPGEQLEIDCLIEAFPKPTSYWSERQFIRPTALARARPPLNGNAAAANQADELRLQPFGLPSSRWHQGNKFLMVRAPQPPPPPQSAAASGGSSSHNKRPSSRPNNKLNAAHAIVSAQSMADHWQTWRPKRRQIDSSDDSDGWTEETPDDNEHGEQMGTDRHEAPPSNSSSVITFDGASPNKQPTGSSQDEPTTASASIQPPDGLNKAYVTVKQTAINPYTYKLKISIAKMRPIDFGEYVCIASNSMGTSSARVLVKSEYRPALSFLDGLTRASTHDLIRDHVVLNDRSQNTPQHSLCHRAGTRSHPNGSSRRIDPRWARI
jgi:hypothetical protein